MTGPRSLDLADFGVDLNSTFDQLVSAEGIVNQFALSIVIQIIYIVGYVVSGAGPVNWIFNLLCLRKEWSWLC